MENILKNNISHASMLKASLKNLNEFSFLSGAEGRVYFVDDNFVIKVYNMGTETKYFNEFCTEIKGFADRGYNVPKIYAWTTEKYDKYNSNLYVLEERIKGKNIFMQNIAQIYANCKNFCSKDEFAATVLERDNNAELFSYILREYLKEYINVNEQLLALPEEEVEKFILSEYKMGTKAHYSWIDVHPKNVMFDGKKLTHIDNKYMTYPFTLPAAFVKSTVLVDMYTLFYPNGDLKKYKKYIAANDKLQELLNQNEETCFLTMRRFIRKAKELINVNSLKVYDYSICEQAAKDAVGQKLGQELSDEIMFERG